MNIDRQIQGHLDAATNLALAELERLARKILAKHHNLDEFFMGMGEVVFSTKDGQNFWPEDRRYTKPVARFLFNWDRILYLTGHPMRFTATGPVVTEW